MRRFYFSPEHIRGQRVRITGRDAHHIRHVLRLGPDEEIILIDGHGTQYRAQLKEFQDEWIVAELGDPIADVSESPLNLVMAQGFLKEKKMDLLVRQLTELGVHGWVPFMARRSVPVLDAKRRTARVERWQKITQEALKQCRRSQLMQVEPIVSFEEALTMAEPFEIKLIFWENEKRPLTSVLGHSVPPKSAFAMIGPEGGFDEAEIRAAQKKGFLCAGLGARILRAETATLTVCVLLQHILGDLG